MTNFPWHKHYPASVDQEVNYEAYSSIVDLFDESVKKFGGSVAFECMGKTMTFAELDALSIQFANYLTHVLKLEKGSRVAIQMPNILQYPVAMFGALRAGMVVVNTNPLYTPSEMKHQFNDSGADVIVIVENFASNLEKIRSEIQVKHIITTELGDLLGVLKGFIVNVVVKHLKKMVPAFSLPGSVSFKSTLSKGASFSFKPAKMSLSDPAFLQYTGGTTGVSKGAELTHGNIVANMQQISAWMKPKLKESEEIVITALPLYHIFALTVNCLAMLKIGAHNVLITNPRDMKAFIGDLAKKKFTVMTGVNTLFNGLLNQEAFKALDFSALKIAVGGGMAVQKVTAEKWKAVTGVPLAEGYGLTETSPVASCNPIDGTERIGTIGVPLPNTEIMIADDAGIPLPIGERGEIYIKGPQVMKGYWNRPEETANVMQGDWFKSGDIGVMDEDGFVKIVDRKKEMILVSGFNVYPNEVEDAVASCPGVLEVGVIGMPDPKSTEKVVAYVVKKEDAVSAEKIIQHCKNSLTNYKVPKEVYFTDELPKSNVGKILRRKIKEAHMEKMGIKPE
ncbi:long-chain acyl-CoA synthetase [Algoriphagus alkaliphilus]|uniref:Long-chain-fatty-acid--CoA ligase n=1 Tax=Algoriphagus alkaliphilus TaxID=279824 RepID=A0A1G5VEI5_9BACT|nr:AMP-binding protein [Algoriphagus alkaliphilus]MBA4299753.1 long-chain-fatty-acid--CoA ligase [Cyclobacterium sp.]SDA44108.1 long-chain acyl-CoA synthetase [Algoriphagus alkaliphilus]